MTLYAHFAAADTVKFDSSDNCLVIICSYHILFFLLMKHTTVYQFEKPMKIKK